MMMTNEAIRLCIKRKELYENPDQIERLYLHNKGFVEIQNLSKFTQVRHLFLEGNALKTVTNIDDQKLLQSLYLQDNKLEKIENLERCVELKYLDVSKNFITTIDNLSSLANLESLIMKKNKLSKLYSINHVMYMKSLRELDLSKNQINCSPEGIIEVLSKCKALRILSLKGNPIAKTKYYRKLVVSRIRKLTHLDGKPIGREERRRCNAWGGAVAKGGSYDEADEADRRELIKIRTEISEANAIRSFNGVGGDDASCLSRSSIGNSIASTIKRAFGLLERHQSSSYISVSSSRRLSEELVLVRAVVESQRGEILHLKEKLGRKQSEESQKALHMIDTILDANKSATDDSERDVGYSLETNQKLAEKASLRMAADMQKTIVHGDSNDIPEQAKNSTAKSSLFFEEEKQPKPPTNNPASVLTIGLQEVDVFSIMPPLPPSSAFT